MAFCSVAPRNILFPFERLRCGGRRRWSSSCLVDSGRSAFVLKARGGGGGGGAACACHLVSLFRYGARKNIGPPSLCLWSNPSLYASKHHSTSCFARNLSALYEMRNVYGSVSLRVAARSFHESSEGGEHDIVGEENGELVEDDQDALEISLETKAQLKAGLYLVGTPIGNLEDITLRALRVLKSATLILAEDTRHSSRLLRHYEIRTPTMSYHKFNEIARRGMVLERLRRGEILALISDAGMPGISDPGCDIVRACVEANVDIFPIPGPSAVITALVASGLPTDEFSFVGFLPAQSTSRQKRLATAAGESATQVLYVPPHKLGKILDDCVSAFGPSRRCAVAREMTKLHEEFWRGTLEQAQTEFKSRSPRGEITFIVEGVPEGSRDEPVSEDELKSRLQSLMDTGKSPSEATKQVVLDTSARRNLVYTLALSMRQKQKS